MNHKKIEIKNNQLDSLKIISNKEDEICISYEKNNAELGIELLKELKNESIGQITIMPGEGINIKNCLLFKNEKFEAIHFSAWKPLLRKNISNEYEKIKTFDSVIGHSDENIIKDIVLKINI